MALLWFAGCASDVAPPDDGLPAAEGEGEGAADEGEAGAPEDPPDVPPADPGCVDDDEDGVCVSDDCDDSNRGVLPGGVEACNGVDEDCDGATDEGLHDTVCGVGACRTSAPNCVEGRPLRCEPLAPAEEETCDGVDEDCDGETDEDAGGSECGVGACLRRAPCADGVEGVCEPGSPGQEVCAADGVDEDCDGMVDEGFGAEAVHTTYTEIRAHHATCDGVGERIGSYCDTGMHRLCAARPCKNSGFGPLENSGDIAHVGCVNGERHDASFAVLAAQHEVCDGIRERRGPHCNAAIHRLCQDQGHASGFGPVWIVDDNAQVTCLPGSVAEVVQTTYTELSTHHPPCEGAVQRIGPDCNAAISRFCRSRGAATGFGPVENSGDAAAVVCVSP